jgi:hypothetical protein
MSDLGQNRPTCRPPACLYLPKADTARTAFNAARLKRIDAPWQTDHAASRPPWRADKIPGGYVARDNGQALAYVYSRENEAEARQAKVLTQDEARRLPELLGKAERGNAEIAPTSTNARHSRGPIARGRAPLARGGGNEKGHPTRPLAVEANGPSFSTR